AEPSSLQKAGRAVPCIRHIRDEFQLDAAGQGIVGEDMVAHVHLRKLRKPQQLAIECAGCFQVFYVDRNMVDALNHHSASLRWNIAVPPVEAATLSAQVPYGGSAAVWHGGKERGEQLH